MKDLGCSAVILFVIFWFLMSLMVHDTTVAFWITLLLVIGGVVWFFVSLEKSKNKAAAEARQSISEAPKRLIALADALPIRSTASIALKKGEEFFYRLEGVSLIESRSNGSTYQGGSRGVSIRVMKGVSYRVGASKGQLIKNPETLQVVDTGAVSFTNQRILFVGTKASREWDLSKLTDMSQTPGRETVMISVSNRQKPSGIQSLALYAIKPGVLADIAYEYNQKGVDGAKDQCLLEAGVKKPSEQRQTDTPSAVPETPKLSVEPLRVVDSSMKPVELTFAYGDEIVEVVGESFYAEAFEQIRTSRNIEYGDEKNFVLDLVAEPFNKFSQNGHAVAVQFEGKVIGHISEDENTEFFEILKEFNGKGKCEGSIYFAPVAQVMKNSVNLFVTQPLSHNG